MSAALTTAPRGRGKGRRAGSRSPAGSDTDPPLDLQASLLALQQEARQDRENTQAQLAALNQGIQGLLNRTQDNPVPADATTPSQTVNPELERESPAPSSGSQYHSNYKPKAKDPLRFDNNQGVIKYLYWKEQILDKFEVDCEQFSTDCAFMSYVFNQTEGKA